MREPAGVGLYPDHHVVGLRRAEDVTVDLQRAVILVDLDIVEERAVAAPYHLSVGVLDDVGKVRAVGPAAHADREEFRAAGVGAPGMQQMVGRMPGTAELEVGRSLRERVTVEDDRWLSSVARHAADQLVLAAFAEPAQVGEGPIRPRNAGIVLLDAATHLRHQRLL
jgi:hypothetical protein